MIDYVRDRRVAILSIGAMALYWIAIIIVPPTVMLEILDSVTLALTILLLTVYLPLAHHEMRKNRLDRTGRLVVGIAIAWSCTFVLRFMAQYGRSFGRLTDFIESAFFPFLIYGLVWSALLHITAPYADVPGETIPFGRWIAVCLIVGGLVAGFFLGVQFGAWFELTDNPPMTG